MNARPSIYPSIHPFIGPHETKRLVKRRGENINNKSAQKVVVCTCVLYRIFPKYAHLSNLLTRVRKKDSYKEEEDWVDEDK